MQIYPQVQFKKVESTKLQEAFFLAFSKFSPLHHRHILIERRAFPETIMRAQPVVNHLFFHRNLRGFTIQINSKPESFSAMGAEELPFEVLVGWFAHELGHILDYLDRPGLNMIHFGLSYVWSKEFRIQAEYAADHNAIKMGLSDHLITMKKWLFEESTFPAHYLQRLQKYYMQIDQVRFLAGVEQKRSQRNIILNEENGLNIFPKIQRLRPSD